MERTFKRLSDHRKIDLIPYVKEKLAEDKSIKLYVGSDSQNIGDNTVYAMVIVFHYGNNGGHVIYSKRVVPRIKDRFTKLWGEVQDSVDLAQHLEANGVQKPTYIDLDFNPDPKYKSNDVLRAALGYVEAMGYSARCKPYAISASCVADKICK